MTKQELNVIWNDSLLLTIIGENINSLLQTQMVCQPIYIWKKTRLERTRISVDLIANAFNI